MPADLSIPVPAFIAPGHTFRPTGIPAYLKSNVMREAGQHIANHDSPRTTKVERIAF